MKQEFYFQDIERTVYNKVHYLDAMDGLMNSYLEAKYYGKIRDEIISLEYMVADLKSQKESIHIYYIDKFLKNVFRGSFYNSYVPEVGESFSLYGEKGVILESIYSASDDTMIHYTDITNNIVNETDSALELEMKRERNIKIAQELIDKYSVLLESAMKKAQEELQKIHDGSQKKWWKFW